MSNINTILFGGKNITVQFEPIADAAAESGFRIPDPQPIKVRMVRVGEYEDGFAYVEAMDEPALVGFLAGRNKAWALTLAPDSYEEILETGREVNAKRFFSYCQRRMEQIEKANATMYGVMATMSPEKMKLAMEKGAQMMKDRQFRSPSSLPGSLPPPVR